MMLLIVGNKCSRPALPTTFAQSYTFFITIKKVCAHDEKTRCRALLAYDQDFQPKKLLVKTSKTVDR